MIEGIEILNKTEITHTANYIIGLLIVFIALIIIGVTIAVHGANIFNDILSGLGIALVVIGFIAIVVLGVINPQQSTGEYEYQVTINDSVSLVEFYETYDIISQEGQIWTIREKTNE